MLIVSYTRYNIYRTYNSVIKSYKSHFRNNVKDQTDLFNKFFSDQFSDPSNYDIPINFCGFDIQGPILKSEEIIGSSSNSTLCILSIVF